jgi:SRSO17 transposase
MGHSNQTPALEEPRFELSERQVRQLADELVEYHGQFRGLFYRSEQVHWALKYLQGLMLPGCDKSVEGIAQAVEGGNVRNMQQFLGEGAWDDEALLARHAELVAESLGEPDGVLIIDGSQFPKKGEYSAGVARQWCGVLGKVDNCQAGVFLGYAGSQGHTLLDRRLYLPREWFEVSSRERWERCGIPDETQFRTKPELAWEMIEQVVEQDALPCRWVTCDEAYGDSPRLLDRIDEAGLWYFADVSCSTRVWLERPRTEVPDYSGHGRPPSRPRLAEDASEPVRVDELARSLPEDAWSRHRVKDGEKGPIEAQFAFVRATAVREGLPGPAVWVVLRRSLGDQPELKYFLSNAPANIERKKLVRLSGMRWPIEICFEEAKGSLGMDEYQTRSWLGWHHHMTLVILAHHFLVRMRLKHKKGPHG